MSIQPKRCLSFILTTDWLIKLERQILTLEKCVESDQATRCVCFVLLLSLESFFRLMLINDVVVRLIMIPNICTKFGEMIYPIKAVTESSEQISSFKRASKERTRTHQYEAAGSNEQQGNTRWGNHDNVFMLLMLTLLLKPCQGSSATENAAKRSADGQRANERAYTLEIRLKLIEVAMVLRCLKLVAMMLLWACFASLVRFPALRSLLIPLKCYFCAIFPEQEDGLRVCWFAYTCSHHCPCD